MSKLRLPLLLPVLMGKWTPKSIPGLKLWLRADDIAGSDGDAISTWTDRAQTVAFTQTGDKRPLLKTGANGMNGHNIVRFQAVDDLLVTSTLVDSSAQGTCLIVFKPTNNFVNGGALLCSADEATGTRQLRIDTQTSGSTYIGVSQRDNDTGDNVIGSTALALARAYVGVWVSNGTAYSIRLSQAVQGLTVASGGNNGDWFADVSARDNFTVGGRKRNTEDSFFRGDIAEILLYDTALSDANILKLEEYLIEKYALISEIANPDNAAAANAVAALTTPTYDTSGEAVHPDVYDAGSGSTWNGYRYWMAMTPYPANDAQYENPSILASADGTTWEVPVGLTNPIDPQPGTYYNSDTDLLMVGTRLWCIYREVRENVGGTDYEIILGRYSDNGVTWSDETTLLTVSYATGNSRVLSPAMYYDGTTYYMWTGNKSTTPNSIDLRTASALTGPWSDPVECTFNRRVTAVPTTLTHLDVIKVGSYFYALIMDETGIAVFASSADGLTWQLDSGDTLPSGGVGTWDKIIYRGCLVWNGTNFDLWYSANNDGTPKAWHIGRTTVTGVVTS